MKRITESVKMHSLLGICFIVPNLLSIHVIFACCLVVSTGLVRRFGNYWANYLIYSDEVERLI